MRRGSEPMESFTFGIRSDVGGPNGLGMRLLNALNRLANELERGRKSFPKSGCLIR